MGQSELQRAFFIHSLSHVCELFGTFQRAVLRTHKLEPIHWSFLLRAARHAKVSFDRIRHDTGVKVHTISRAAYHLEDCGFGVVRRDQRDRRRRRFHINEAGMKVVADVELGTARALLRAIGAGAENSRRYYDFTIHLWNLTRFLPESRCAAEGFYFPSEVSYAEKVPEDSIDFSRFKEDLLRKPRPAMRETDLLME